MRRLTFSEPALSCLATGPEGGPVVLFLHGFPDVPSSFEGLMRAVAAQGHQAIAPWMPGYAPSSLEGPFDPESNAGRLLSLCDRVSPDRPLTVVGHDWGAVITYQMLATAPARFSRAVTMSVPHPMAFVRNLARHPRQLRRSWYMGFFQIPALSDVVVRRDDFAFIERLWAAWSPSYQPPEALMGELKRCLAASHQAPIDYYRHTARAAGQLGRGENLAIRAPVEVPTLYLHGADDGCVGSEIAQGQERFFAASLRQEVLGDAGHFLHLERPAEVEETVVGWISDADER